MKSFFKELLQYTYRYNDEVINSLLKNEIIAVPEKSLQLINHTINAQEVWNARIEGELCKTLIWELRPLDRLLEINKSNFEKSHGIVEKYDLDAVISYSNSKGSAYKNTVRDIIFHIVNHSTYHRGQIATDSKQNGLTPLVTDYIFYKRE